MVTIDAKDLLYLVDDAVEGLCQLFGGLCFCGDINELLWT